MAKRDSNIWEEIKSREEELKQMRQTAREDLESQLQTVLSQMDEMGFETPQFLVERVTNRLPLGAIPTPRKEKGTRQPRSCNICKAAGQPELAKGHVAKGHEKWLAKQPANIRAHFKGTLTEGGEARVS